MNAKLANPQRDSSLTRIAAAATAIGRRNDIRRDDTRRNGSRRNGSRRNDIRRNGSRACWWALSLVVLITIACTGETAVPPKPPGQTSAQTAGQTAGQTATEDENKGGAPSQPDPSQAEVTAEDVDQGQVAKSDAQPKLANNDMDAKDAGSVDAGSGESGDLPDTDLPPESSDMDLEPRYEDPRKHAPAFAANETWAKLSPDFPLWADLENKQVIVDGRIVQVQAALEMFACPMASGKEHESIVGVFSDAKLVHAALLSVGAKPGRPVQFQPEYQAASGTKISIMVEWEENGEMKTADAKQWVRDWKTKQVLASDWVFGGSMIYREEETGKEYYLAEGGELICVSNFATATLDLPIESSAAASDQVFEAYTDNIPPLGTLVRLYLKPELENEN